MDTPSPAVVVGKEQRPFEMAEHSIPEMEPVQVGLAQGQDDMVDG